MRKILKDILFAVLGIFAGGLKDRASILMYHSVGETQAFFTVRPKEFEWQLKYLKEKKCNVIKLSELVRRLKAGESISNCVSITFDDGYKDNYTNAFPLLKKYGFPATIFLITGSIGEKQTTSDGTEIEMLSDSDIRDMYASGLIECMPHSVSHEKFAELSDKEAQDELTESRNTIEGMLGEDSNIFAYPFGSFNGSHMEMLKKGGWRGAVTVKEGLVGMDSDLFQLPRNAIDSCTSRQQFKGKVSGAISLYKKFRP